MVSPSVISATNISSLDLYNLSIYIIFQYKIFIIKLISTRLAQGAIKHIKMPRLVWIFSPFFLDIFSIHTC